MTKRSMAISVGKHDGNFTLIHRWEWGNVWIWGHFQKARWVDFRLQNFSLYFAKVRCEFARYEAGKCLRNVSISISIYIYIDR